MSRVWLGCILLPVSCWAGGAGMVTAVKGSVRRVPAGKTTSAKATAMQLLSVGDKLKVGTASSATIVLFKNGARFQLSSGTTATIGAEGLRDVTGGKPKTLKPLNTRVAKTLASSRVASGRAGSVVLRGGSSRLELKSLGNTAIRTDRPVFRWEATAGAASYTVTVLDESDRKVWSGTTNSDHIAYPATAPALEPYAEYLWTVQTVVNGRRIRGEGLFLVLAKDERDAVEEELGRYKDIPDDSMRLLLQSEVFAQHELWDDALACYRKLLSSSPDSPRLHQVLADMLADQGQNRESRKHRELAKQGEAVLTSQ